MMESTPAENSGLDPFEAPPVPSAELFASKDAHADAFLNHPEDTLEAALSSFTPVAPQAVRLRPAAYEPPPSPVIQPAEDPEIQATDDRLLAGIGFGVAILMAGLTVMMLTM